MLAVVKDIIHLFIVVTIVNVILYGLPIPKLIKKCRLSSYMIEGNNRFEYQQNRECGGYSTAYVLRNLGIDIDGLTAYNQIPFKLLHGNVSGIGIILLCLRYKMNVLLRIGNIEALKDSVCKGIPVVVLTRSVVGSRGLHYITVVGFDNDYIYTADSVKDHKNSDDSRYNRKISISDFKKIWQTSLIYQPLMFNLFFEIKK